MLLSHLPVLVLLGAVATHLNTAGGTVTSPLTPMSSSSPDSGWTSTSDAMTSTQSATSSTPAANAGMTSSTQSTELRTTSEPISTGAAATTETSHPATAHSETTAALTAGDSTTPTDNSPTVSPVSATSPDSAITTSKPTEIYTSSVATTAESSLTTMSPPLVCPWTPCPPLSVCLNSTCHCLSGSLLIDGQCQPGHVFPGQLHLPNLVFEEEMYNRSSSIFQSTATNILTELKNVLHGKLEYIGSVVVHLEPGSVLATVNTVFGNTTISERAVYQLIQTAINTTDGFFANATFTRSNLCESEVLPCEVSTSTCRSSAGVASCPCKEGYVTNEYSPYNCKACPSGQKAVGSSCQPCPFGYAGFNCNDSSLLVLVVVSCVLGGVLLILILALLAYCCWRLCSKSSSDYGSSPYSLDDLNQPWPTSVTPIPRASTNWNSTPSIELTEGGSTNTLVDKKPQSNGLSASYDLNPEAMKTFKGKNTSRYSYLVQGHENPYFLPGDDKKD